MKVLDYLGREVLPGDIIHSIRRVGSLSFFVTRRVVEILGEAQQVKTEASPIEDDSRFGYMAIQRKWRKTDAGGWEKDPDLGCLPHTIVDLEKRGTQSAQCVNQ